MRPARLSKEQSLQKIRHFCAYQERCHQEVKEKLYSFGLHKEDTESLIAALIEENYLDEERFATQFAGGKFRMNHWGKIKIEYELRKRQLSPYCIRKGLEGIGADAYRQTLEKLAREKWSAISGETPLSIRAKVTSYLLQKGYGMDDIRAALKNMRE
jgi:regulatory protein